MTHDQIDRAGEARLRLKERLRRRRAARLSSLALPFHHAHESGRGSANSETGLFRYRLLDGNAVDLGPFVSRVGRWQPGDRITRKHDEVLEISAVVPSEEESFRAYLVVAHATAPGTGQDA